MSALLAGMIRRNVLELRRYAFDTTFEVVGLFVLFLAVFFGAKGVGGTEVRHNGTLSAIVIGFMVFSLVVFSYSSIAAWTTQEATLGTLEQLAMSPFGLLRVLIAEFVAGIVNQIVIIGALFGLAELTTGQRLHIDLLTLTPLVLLLFVQLLGVGLMIGGAAIVFKRVVSLINVIQFGFIGLIAAPVTHYPLLKFLPVALGNHLIRRNSVDGVGLLDLGGRQLAFHAAVSVGYLLLGVAVFRWSERVARDRGLIGVH